MHVSNAALSVVVASLASGCAPVLYSVTPDLPLDVGRYEPVEKRLVVGEFDSSRLPPIDMDNNANYTMDGRNIGDGFRRTLQRSFTDAKVFAEASLEPSGTEPYLLLHGRIQRMHLINNWGESVSAVGSVSCAIDLMPERRTVYTCDFEERVDTKNAKTSITSDDPSRAVDQFMAAASAKLLAEVAAKASTLGAPGASVASARPATSTSAITFPVASVAVMPAKLKGKATQAVAEVLEDLVLSSLDSRSGGQLRVVAKSDVDAMLGYEKLKDAAGCDDVSCAAEIAGALGVDSIISANVATLGEKYILTLVWIDQRHTRVLKRHSETLGASQEDFDKGVQRAVSALLDIR